VTLELLPQTACGWLAIGTSAAILGLWIHIVLRNMTSLRALKPLAQPAPDLPLPKLSVVVAARNEEAAIAECLNRLLAQDITDLEIIAVNDRSTDRTGEIIRDLAQKVAQGPAGEHRQIRPIDIESLPAGWLGKCHALQRGSEQATGDWLLFLDGDVLLDPHALRWAVAAAQNQGAGFLTLFPGMIPGKLLERSMMIVFAMGFLYKFSPARAMDPNSPDFIGVGAFNMIRRDYYQRLGGHEPLRMMIIDDVGLGALAKRNGVPVFVADGAEVVRVRWYPSLMSMIRGLEKNAFAGLRYSLRRTILASVAVLALYWGPLLFLIFGPLLAKISALPAVLLLPVMGYMAARKNGFGGLLPGLLLPIGSLLFVFTVLRSAAITLCRQGVSWRDSFYPLSELRQHTLPD
jgi:glycosyltransferase involved in cell wall biosynthesis